MLPGGRRGAVLSLTPVPAPVARRAWREGPREPPAGRGRARIVPVAAGAVSWPAVRRSRSVFLRDSFAPAAWPQRRGRIVASYVSLALAAGFGLAVAPGLSPTQYGAMAFVWVLITALVLWRLHWIRRNTHPPGHCSRCGYNLTGNASGTCPECGTPAPEDKA